VSLFRSLRVIEDVNCVYDLAGQDKLGLLNYNDGNASSSLDTMDLLRNVRARDYTKRANKS